MSELVFILSDFFAAASDSEPARRVNDALPRLPALEMLLARAQRAPLTAGWRGWLAVRAGAHENAQGLAAAQLVAAAFGRSEPARGHWLATPVHLFAGLDSAHLHPAGLLWLTEAEQQALVTQFERVFTDGPWKLHALGERELLLSGPALQASGADPAVMLGADPRAAMPRGVDAAALRRLGSEIEMWLFEHAINRERERRGELPITTLWLWGARLDAANAASSDSSAGSSAASGASARSRSLAPLPHLYGRDTFARALWRRQGAPTELLPSDAAAVALFERGARNVVLYPLSSAAGLVASLQQFEQHWLAPALAALRARRLRGLWLLTGSYSYRLRRLDLARLWRAGGPWWQRLQ